MASFMFHERETIDAGSEVSRIAGIAEMKQKELPAPA